MGNRTWSRHREWPLATRRLSRLCRVSSRLFLRPFTTETQGTPEILEVNICYGNIIPLGDLAHFAPGENDELMKLAVVHGIDPSTVVRALKAGKF